MGKKGDEGEVEWVLAMLIARDWVAFIVRGGSGTSAQLGKTWRVVATWVVGCNRRQGRVRWWYGMSRWRGDLTNTRACTGEARRGVHGASSRWHMGWRGKGARRAALAQGIKGTMKVGYEVAR